MAAVSLLRQLPLARSAVCSLAVLAGSLLLSACAQLGTPPPRVDGLIHDAYYPGVGDPVTRESVLALSDAMRAYIEQNLSAPAVQREPRRALLDALYRDGALRLSYDAGITRNAAEAFDARTGNCLSLALMTAAFARHLGLEVSFQSVQVEADYTRSGDLLLVSGHVNLLLARGRPRMTLALSYNDDWIVDFLPGSDLRGQRSQTISEDTVLAMYFNNRAAEALAQGERATSYAWARMAVRTDPRFTPAQNTLGVIYLRDGHLAAAETALRQVLAAHADNPSALSNLALLLQRTGRDAEAAQLQAQLARLQPEQAWMLFDQGRLAMDRGEFKLARELFERELRRQPAQSDVLFWAAMADWQLGDAEHAAQHLQQAVAASRTGAARELYAAKLARLRELRAQ